MWTCSFKIIMQMKIKEHLSVHLTSQTTEFTASCRGIGFFCRKYVSFRLYYSPQNFTFPWNLPWNVRKTEANPQWIGSLSAYGSNPPYIDRPLIPSQWNLFANLPFFHPATKIMQNMETSKKQTNKQKKKQGQKRKISSPHDRILAAGHRISFLHLTDTLSFATVCKTIGSALSTTCSSNAMKWVKGRPLPSKSCLFPSNISLNSWNMQLDQLQTISIGQIFGEKCFKSNNLAPAMLSLVSIFW